MTDFETLCAIAYKTEHVLARRRARQAGISFEHALAQVLQQAAGQVSLSELSAARMAAQAALALQRAAHRQARADAHARQRRHAAPPAGAWLAWFDGSTHPNPGRMGLGGVLQSPAGQCIEISRTAGQGDSNQAEYLALIAVLEAALPLRPAHLVVYGDSRVVIDGVTRPHHESSPSQTAVPREGPDLAAPRLRARQLIAQLPAVELQWIARHRNGAADALSQQAIARAQQA
jgi:ribonuclease HI